MVKVKQNLTALWSACLTLLVTLFVALATLTIPTNVTANAAGTGSYVKVTAAPTDGDWSGTYLIVYEDGGVAFDGLLTKLDAASNYKEVAISDGEIEATDAMNKIAFTIAISGDSYTIQSASGYYIGNTSTGNGLSSSTSTAYTNTITLNTDGSAHIVSSGGPVLRYNATSGQDRFRYFKSSTYTSQKEIALYKYVEASGDCEHPNATSATVDATCTEAGSITTTCPDCDYEKTETIPATGHLNTTEVVTTAATCTESGEKTVTCQDCGDVSTATIPATGHDYVDGVCTICSAVESSEGTETLDIFGSTGTLASDSSSISWAGEYVTFTNAKNNSTSAIYTDDTSLFRVYAKSQVTISVKDGFYITKVVITCASAAYATTCKTSVGDNATVSGSVVTIEVAEGVSSVVIDATAQWRLNKVEVSYEKINTCPHTNTSEVTIDATCTEAGSTTVTCDDCGKTVSTTEIPATGHNLDEGVITTEPAIGTEGEKTYTCQNGCGYTETESIPALDAAKYTVSYSVPDGVTAPADEELANGEKVTLPSASALEGFTFVGWVEESCKETKVAPETVYAAESEYTLTVEENITLYALYTYSVGSGNYVKVTEAPADWSGIYLIVYEDENGAYVFNGKDAANGYVSAVVNDSVIAFSEEINAEAVTIAAMDGGYSILTKNGYIYGATKNALNFNTSTAQLNTISFGDNGNVVIVSEGSYLRFNSTSNQMRFRYYTNATYGGEVYLYVLDGATYYATDCSVKIDSASVTIGTDLTVNYYVNMPAVYADAVMYFTMNGETVDVKGEKVTDGQYKFSCKGIAPQYMGDNIAAELKFNEVVIASMAEYSIKTYAQNQLLNESSSEALKQVITDMLYYGEAAQTYCGNNVANLVTSGVVGLCEPSDTVSDDTDKTGSASTSDTKFVAVGVWFDNVNKLYVKINQTENVTVKVTVNGETKEYTTFAATEDSSKYVLYTEAIYATGFDDVYTFELYEGDTLVQTMTYSVRSYVYVKKDKGDNMAALAKALYAYGKSAEAYQATQIQA